MSTKTYPMNHALKTDPDQFRDTADNRKSFEIRLNDRDYQVGDTLTLQETQHSGEQMSQGQPLIYTGNYVVREVTHMIEGPIFGLAEGWVVMSVRPPVRAAAK